MSETFDRYEVTEMSSFYDTMVGKLVHTSDRTVVLEFKINPKMGGLQRVQFFKDQVRYVDHF